MAKLPIPFSNPMTYAGHSGVDYPQPQGTPFRASADGVVTWLGHNAAGGYFIWVKYDGVGPKIGYHHMPSHRGCPRQGARFKAGDRLGYVGNTGRSTGPHLHSEVEGHRTTAGYWQFFDRNRVVGGGNFAGQGEDDMTPEESKLLREIHDRVFNGLTGDRIAASVWKIRIGGWSPIEMLRSLWDDWRIGRTKKWHDGDGYRQFRSEIAAQTNFRARHGDVTVDVKALATELAPLLNEQESDELVRALLEAQGKAYTEAAKTE